MTHPAFKQVMTEHPAWLPAGAGSQRMLTTPDGCRWLVNTNGAALTMTALTNSGTRPTCDVFTYTGAETTEVPQLATTLAELGNVARLRNPDLWDALATAIIRQIIRAREATKTYRRFSQAHGETVTLPNGDTHPLLPTPSTVLSLGAEQFANLGLTIKTRTLKAAAAAYLQHGEQWQKLPPHQLVDQLQTIPRVGPWTARAAVADWSNDWSLYPHDDLAVRTWARRAAPTHPWPEQPAAFGRQWRHIAGPHLSTITLLTLAWGHICSRQQTVP